MHNDNDDDMPDVLGRNSDISFRLLINMHK